MIWWFVACWRLVSLVMMVIVAMVLPYWCEDLWWAHSEMLVELLVELLAPSVMLAAGLLVELWAPSEVVECRYPCAVLVAFAAYLLVLKIVR
jgi:hypothetical protein